MPDLVRVKLSKLQADELAHKMTIVRDEADLLESYEVSDDQVQALLDAIPAAGGVLVVDKQFEDLMVGELENAIEIAEANLECGELGNLSRIGSLRGAIRKIEEACNA